VIPSPLEGEDSQEREDLLHLAPLDLLLLILGLLAPLALDLQAFHPLVPLELLQQDQAQVEDYLLLT